MQKQFHLRNFYILLPAELSFQAGMNLEGYDCHQNCFLSKKQLDLRKVWNLECVWEVRLGMPLSTWKRS